MRTLKYIAFTSLHVAALWFGLVEGMNGLLNIGLAMTWFGIVFSWFMLSDAAINEMTKNKRGAAFLAIDRTIDLGIAGLLIYFGWFVTGLLFAMHIIFCMAGRAEADKRIAAAAELKAMADA